jgi:hypothetical protein
MDFTARRLAATRQNFKIGARQDLTNNFSVIPARLAIADDFKAP